jgi:hypothetical protein
VSDYYTLLMDTNNNLTFVDILKCFHKHFVSSAPDFTHQLHFQSVSQDVGELLCQWADRVRPWLLEHSPYARCPHPCYNAIMLWRGRSQCGTVRSGWPDQDGGGSCGQFTDRWTLDNGQSEKLESSGELKR